MTTSTTQRSTEAIGPPWCEGHVGGYQGWETRADDGGGQIRDHGEHGHRVSNATVTVTQTESDNHALSSPIVELFVDGVHNCDVADLTPAQARELAAVLVSAAERAEAPR